MTRISRVLSAIDTGRTMTTTGGNLTWKTLVLLDNARGPHRPRFVYPLHRVYCVHRSHQTLFAPTSEWPLTCAKPARRRTYLPSK